MKIDSRNYVENAIKTESPITQELKERNLKYLPNLKFLIKEQIKLGTEIDKFKKGIYYGKSIDKLCPSLFCDKSELERGNENFIIRLSHGIIGCLTEITELFEVLDKYISLGEPIDLINIQEECGDSFWYQALILNLIDKDMNETLEKNINKLKTRYPNKFIEKDAINRDLDKERTILEN